MLSSVLVAMLPSLPLASTAITGAIPEVDPTRVGAVVVGAVVVGAVLVGAVLVGAVVVGAVVGVTVAGGNSGSVVVVVDFALVVVGAAVVGGVVVGGVVVGAAVVGAAVVGAAVVGLVAGGREAQAEVFWLRACPLSQVLQLMLPVAPPSMSTGPNLGVPARNVLLATTHPETLLRQRTVNPNPPSRFDSTRTLLTGPLSDWKNAAELAVAPW